jgi:hypothetical protein
LNCKNLDRDYSKLDYKLKEMKPIKELGLPEEFYGGQVSHIASTEFQNILILLTNKIDGLRVVDVAVKDLNRLTLESLKTIAIGKGYKKELDKPENEKITKDQIIKMISQNLIEVAI